jgi:molybdopterin biosynthesis enzyme MoaB
VPPLINQSKGIFMKRTHFSAIAFALASLTAAQAFAGDHAHKTRDQVRAELVEAQKFGDIVANGDTGLTAREQRPDLFPARPVVSKTRSQVKAELAEAVRTGNIVTNGDTGLTARERRPDLFPARPVVSKTRSQVKAELAEAVRTGNIVTNGDTGLTAREQRPDLY